MIKYYRIFLVCIFYSLSIFSANKIPVSCKTSTSPIIFNLTPSNRTVCRGEKVNFVVGAMDGPSGNYIFTWNPFIYLSSPTGSIQAGEPLSTTIYTISAYDVADPSFIIYTSFTVTVKQPPTPSITIPTSSNCEPSCYLFNSHATPQASSIIYYFGNNNSFEGDSNLVCLNAGTHYLKIITTGINGCKGTYDYTTPIVVNPKPGSNFSYSPLQPNLTNNVVNFNASTQNGSSFTYKWFFDSTDSSSLQNPIKIYTNIGSHTVKLIVKNNFGCSDTVSKSIVVATALRDLGLYPNPANNNLNIELGILSGGNATIEIFDVIGQIVFEGKINSFQTLLDISFLANGFYTLKAESNGIVRKENFIKK